MGIVLVDVPNALTKPPLIAKRSGQTAEWKYLLQNYI
jgi:hypothetical protein